MYTVDLWISRELFIQRRMKHREVVVAKLPRIHVFRVISWIIKPGALEQAYILNKYQSSPRTSAFARLPSDRSSAGLKTREFQNRATKIGLYILADERRMQRPGFLPSFLLSIIYNQEQLDTCVIVLLVLLALHVFKFKQVCVHLYLCRRVTCVCSVCPFFCPIKSARELYILDMHARRRSLLVAHPFFRSKFRPKKRMCSFYRANNG